MQLAEPEPEPELEEGVVPALGAAQPLLDALVGQPFTFRTPYSIASPERMAELPEAISAARGNGLRRILESVHHLSEGRCQNLRNVHYLCEAGTVQALVRLFDDRREDGGDDSIATKALVCLSALGRHSMDKEALRWLLRLVVKPDLSSHATKESVLLLVLRTVVQKDGPETFVDLRDPLPLPDGAAPPPDRGGVRMTPLEAWPADGYMVLLWLRLEEPAVGVDGDGERAVVRYCSQDGASGWQLVMVSGQLQLSLTTSTLAKRGLKVQKLELEQWTCPEGEWVHVALVHRRNKLKSSTVTLFVNGELQPPDGASADDGGMVLSYPEIAPPITQCHIGNLETQNRWTAQRGFCGQLGPVLVCDHTHVKAGPGLLAEVYKQGPDSFLWLDPAAARCDFTLPEESRLASQRLHLQVCHAFVPQAYLTRMQLDAARFDPRCTPSHPRNTVVVARASDEDAPTSPRHSFGIGATTWVDERPGLVGRACFLQSKAFKESLACLGGPRCVIPMFAVHESEHDVSLLFRLLCELFTSDESSVQTMATCGAFKMIAELLGRTHLGNLGPKVVDSVRALAETLPKDTAAHADLQLHLVWHFPLWVYTPEACQNRLIELLEGWVAADGPFFRKLIGVQRMLDMIRLCYWDEENPGIKTRLPQARRLPSSVLPIYLSSATARTSSRSNMRPSRAVLVQLRLRLLGIIEAMAAPGVTLPECRAIVAFAIECPDPMPVCEVTEMILRLYTLPGPASMAGHLEKLGGPLLFLSGFGRHSPEIDAALMRVLSIIGSPSKKSKQLDIEALVLAATSQVEGRPQTEACLGTMIRLLFGNVASPAEVSASDAESVAAASRVPRGLLAERPAVRYPALLDCILRAVSMSEEGVRKRVILDLTPVIVADKFAALTCKSGWQQSLLEVACLPRLGATDNQAVVATITAVANLFRKALLFFFRKDEGHMVWQETLVLMEQAATNEGMHYVVPFRQIVFRGMLVELQSEIGTEKILPDQDIAPVFVNIFHFLACQEDWYAFGASSTGAFATEDDLLSCDFIDLYSNFLFSVADKFRAAPSSLDHPSLSQSGQTLFDVLLAQMLEALRHKASFDMLQALMPMFQLNRPMSACMDHRRLVFAVVQLMECVKLATDELEGWEQDLKQTITDILQRRWDEFVDDTGALLLGSQSAMMPDTESFSSMVFGEAWEPHLAQMRRLAEETKETGQFRTQRRVSNIFNSSAVSALDAQLGDLRAQDNAAAEKLTASSRTLAKEMERDETNRVTAVLPRIHQRHNAKVFAQLAVLVHEFCAGRGVFAPPSEATSEEIEHWKIDATELNRGARMRLRLERDPAGRAYASASSAEAAAEGGGQLEFSPEADRAASPNPPEVADATPATEQPAEEDSTASFCAGFLREAEDTHAARHSISDDEVVREVDVVWENQRAGFSSGFSEGNLLAIERGPWTDESGRSRLHKDDWECVEGWEWQTEWMAELGDGVDADGWAYAQSFPAPLGWRASRSRISLVRRRRWVRLRRLCDPDLHPGTKGCTRFSGRSSGRSGAGVGSERLASVLESLGASSTELLDLAVALDYDETMLRESLAAFDNDAGQASVYLKSLVMRESSGMQDAARPEPAALARVQGDDKSLLVASFTQLLHFQHGGSTDEERVKRQELTSQFGLTDSEVDECVEYLGHIFEEQRQENGTTRVATEPGSPEARAHGEDEGEWEHTVSNSDLSILQESRDDTQAYNEEVPEQVFGCTWITPMRSTLGSFSLTQAAMYFTPFDLNEMKEQRWEFTSLKHMNRRRYLMAHTAYEFFFHDGKSCFIDFPIEGDSRTVIEIIRQKKPPRLDRSACTFTSQDVARKARELSSQWQANKIDNYHYLVALNGLAGRSYSDLTQYPVMPWVLADYTSSALDLDNPATFRDLSKPVGALCPERLARFHERADALDDDSVPWFLFGTHYSTAAAALHYLVRLEPFSGLHVDMQSGRFDQPDRLFHSIAATWSHCSSNENLSDVKELTPEFFYCPELFRNEAKLPLGTRTDGVAVDDVILPPWADTPEDFVRLHREALESPYVSSQLHQWVDLVFGYKQQGEAAREASNVFFHLTYEGAVSTEGMDPIQQEAIKSQLQFFGQTPVQIFKKAVAARKPHPPLPILKLTVGDGQILPLVSASEPLPAPVAIGVVSERGEDVLYTLHASAELRTVRVPVNTTAGEGSKRQQLSVLKQQLPVSGPQLIPTARASAFAHDCRLLLLGCAWDCSLKIFRTAAPCKLLASVIYHRSAISCIGLSEREDVLVLGSRDTNVSQWSLPPSVGADGRPVESLSLGTPQQTYFEHAEEVTAVACNVDLDTVASASIDGTIVLHCLRTGTYVRTIAHASARIGAGSYSFTEMSVTCKQGSIVAVATLLPPDTDGATAGTVPASEPVQSELLFHSLNGRLLNRVELSAADSQPVILSGGGGGGALAWASGRLTELLLSLEGTEVVVRDLHERPLHDLVRFRTGHQRGERHGAVPSAVSVTLAENGVLYVGLADGTVLRQAVNGVIPRVLRRAASASAS